MEDVEQNGSGTNTDGVTSSESNSNSTSGKEGSLILERFFRKKQKKGSDSGTKESISLRTKLSFISVSIAVIFLFIVLSLAITARLAVGEFLCNKPSLNSLPSNSTGDIYFDRLSDILVIPVGFLHIPEHIYLLYYLYKFLKCSKSWNKVYKEAIWIKMKTFVISKWGRAFFYAVIVTIFMVIGIGLPPICIVRLYVDKVTSSEHCSQELDMIAKILTHIFHFSSLFTNIIIVLVRLLMITFTVMVGVMWREVKPAVEPTNDELERGNESDETNLFSIAFREVCMLEGEGECSETTAMEEGEEESSKTDHHIVFAEVCKTHTKYMLEYTLISAKVGPVYRIFRSFFVLQWIIHLFGLFCHIAHLLRPWIRYGQVHNANMLIVSQQVDQLCYVIFHGLALVITHVCGLKMNAYMRRYIREIQKNQFEKPLNEFLKYKEASCNFKERPIIKYSLTHLLPIKQGSVYESTFTPRIPGTGLSISITNPGFVVSIVLSTFGLIGAMIVF